MVATGNVGLAFALVTASGLATTLGAAFVLCASLAQPRLLAGSLGFAAGVMLYVSFCEIFLRKSVASFETVTLSDAQSYRWATLCFFGGMLLVALLDRLVHWLAHVGAGRFKRKGAAAANSSTANLLSHEDEGCRQCSQQQEAGQKSPSSAPAVVSMQRQKPGSFELVAAPHGVAAAAAAAGEPPDPELGKPAASSSQLDKADGEAGITDDEASTSSVSTQAAEVPCSIPQPCDSVTGAVVAATSPEVVHDECGAAASGKGGAGGGNAGSHSRTPPAVVEIMEADHHSFMLKKMGLLTGLAIFIHNFPEGLATFVAALADTELGVGLAVAIAMHNIPEGICVAMPIYYATGSRWKGFFWAFLSGVSEPVGGLIGYFALNGSSDLAFGIVFGLVSGMMVYISVKELIPTALRYDPQDSVATSCVIAGMVVMAASLLLFTL